MHPVFLFVFVAVCSRRRYELILYLLVMHLLQCCKCLISTCLLTGSLFVWWDNGWFNGEDVPLGPDTLCGQRFVKTWPIYLHVDLSQTVDTKLHAIFIAYFLILYIFPALKPWPQPHWSPLGWTGVLTASDLLNISACPHDWMNTNPQQPLTKNLVESFPRREEDNSNWGIKSGLGCSARVCGWLVGCPHTFG